MIFEKVHRSMGYCTGTVRTCMMRVVTASRMCLRERGAREEGESTQHRESLRLAAGGRLSFDSHKSDAFTTWFPRAVLQEFICMYSVLRNGTIIWKSCEVTSCTNMTVYSGRLALTLSDVCSDIILILSSLRILVLRTVCCGAQCTPSILYLTE